MTLKVLLCEDNDVIRRLLTATLESEAYEIVAAADGEACVECWRSERPAIVVLDMRMPRRSGPEVLAAVHDQPELAATPVIMMTGATEGSAREAAAAFQPERYMTKPFSPFELINAVEEIGDRLRAPAEGLPAGEIERLARNQSLFRQANERVERIARQLPDTPAPDDLLFSFVCECGQASCQQEIRLTLAEYEELRVDPTHFALLPGHELPEADRLVTRNERFSTVEKLPGRPAEIAVESDPRAG